jgi:hypothetical protein
MRAKRILAQARHEGWMCAVWVSGAIASGVWALMAAMSGLAPGGAVLAVAAVIALRLAAWHWSERRRLIDSVLRAEILWNPPMVITPARPSMDSNTLRVDGVKCGDRYPGATLRP